MTEKFPYIFINVSKDYVKLFSDDDINNIKIEDEIINTPFHDAERKHILDKHPCKILESISRSCDPLPLTRQTAISYTPRGPFQTPYMEETKEKSSKVIYNERRSETE